MQYVALGDTVYFHFALNNESGDGTPSVTDKFFYTRKAGEATDAAPTQVGIYTGLSHASFPDGCYEVAVVASTANGYVAGGIYAVFVDPEVGAIHPTGYIGSFTIDGILTDQVGNGTRTVLVTVNDGAAALEGASVRLTKGSETYVNTTNASGQFTIYLDDGTWTVAITLAGYTFTATTLVVDGNETPTYSMTAVSISASDPGYTTGYLYVYTSAGVVISGIVATIQLSRLPTDSTGLAIDNNIRSTTSTVAGLLQWANLLKGAQYLISVTDSSGNVSQRHYTIDEDATATTALGSLVV